jgi:GT2 family glycosyltransferase
VVYTLKNSPLVSIIIPSKDNFEVFERCVNSIIAKTEYKNYEMIVVDNGSNAENTAKYAALCKKIKAVYKREEEEFNFPRMCNKGAWLAKGDILLFLNDDTEVREGGWLEAMAGQAALDHAGAVGAKLLYPNGSEIQHCGILNLPIGPCHALAPFDDAILHYFCRNRLDYNYLAVTAACLCIEKKKFDEVHGFDESFAVAYNDVELCFKLHEKGYYNSVRNDAVLYHHESLSRGHDEKDREKHKRQMAEMDRLYALHPLLRGKDPFYNVNLAWDRVDFALKQF